MTATGCPVQAHLRHCEVRGLAPTTVRERRQQLGRLAAFLGVELGEDLLLAGEADLDAWQQSMFKHSPNYRDSAITHLREFYGWSLKHRLISSNPTEVLVRPKEPPRLPHPIPADDLDTAIAFAPPRVRPMLVLAAYCELLRSLGSPASRSRTTSTRRCSS